MDVICRQGRHATRYGKERSYNHQIPAGDACLQWYMNPYNNFLSSSPPQYQHGGYSPAQYPPYPSYGRSPALRFKIRAYPPPVVSSYLGRNNRLQLCRSLSASPITTLKLLSRHTRCRSMTVPVLPSHNQPKITRTPFQPPVIPRTSAEHGKVIHQFQCPVANLDSYHGYLDQIYMASEISKESEAGKFTAYAEQLSFQTYSRTPSKVLRPGSNFTNAAHPVALLPPQPPLKKLLQLLHHASPLFSKPLISR